MSLIFTLTSGGEIRDIETIMSNLAANGTYTFKVYNEGSAVTNPGIYMVEGSSYGTLESFTNTTRYADKEDLIDMGSNGIGLSISIDGGNTYSYFKSDAGSSYSNKILLTALDGTIAQAGTIEATIKFEEDNNVSRRFLVGLELE